ncbi:FAD-dependent oxidoreductase [Aestuariimicrobium sp. T2.26MG-19.2B]|uniref:FAD-dependent oxidoreductase n=1 Tax=Aestuariimicrobium sp. T2.26MG-19.2B TaxID=3040679 RepID=UPI002477817B|nr:FAD-dependent oxidoreductase [Aestuariimicrobium sp. T2.26MG-19.2B]CAI9402225.1 Nitrite reductase [NAD(P)H] [Aestuariimicrobium sp. T2.26MG-19.2B]
MRVVVIGHGMVGSRFAADLVEQHPSAHLTVLAREPHAPYNRVLLSSVVSGRTDPSTLALPRVESERARVLTGVPAGRIDLDGHTVTDANGEVHPWHRLVLATGSQARIPDIHGIANPRGLLPGICVLKDLDDAHRIMAALPRSRQAVVLGAGVLGLEVATGLASRGLGVTVVHHSGRVMERQLGAAAAQVATSRLSELGVRVVTNTSVAAVTDRRGVLTGLTLTDGTHLPCELLVMCAGTIPETTLARSAGLPCDRGILVGDDLCSPAADDVFAIGDCAQPPEGATGLVAQGWRQSSRLVELLTGHPATVAPSAGEPSGSETPDLTDVVRVKAPGLDVVTMGLSGQVDHGEREVRTVRLSDPAIGRHVEVVVSQGLLVGATVVGDQQCASELSALYTRMLPVPRDPAHLIVRPLATVRASSATAADLTDDDTVCRCNSVTKARIVRAVNEGCTTVDEVSRTTRASTGCGDCARLVGDIIRDCPTGNANRIPALAGRSEG